MHFKVNYFDGNSQALTAIVYVQFTYIKYPLVVVNRIV